MSDGSRDGKRRPNLLFVFADQMRGMDMGCAGNVEVKTPTLDRLAGEGAMFRQAFANCPVCTPSRATILTGCYPLTHRAVANDVPLPADQTTIANVLREAGYRTGYVGKWHLDGVPRDRFTPPGERRQGFDFWAAWNCAHAYLSGRAYRDGPEPIDLVGYEPVGHTDLALEFLRQQDARPFCLFVSWGTPHAPYRDAPEECLSRYDPAAVTLRANYRDEPPDGFRKLEQPLSPREALAGYYAHITALDEQLGRLLAELERQGSADETIVVFTSDHGDMLWSHGMVKKEQPWAESIRIPLLIRWSGRVAAGRVSDELVSTADFAPTLLRLLGLDVPDSMEGADLSDVVLSDAAAGPESVWLLEPIIVDQGAAQGIRQWRGVRTKRHTYARWYDGAGWLLYDNEADPYQMTNLIDSPDHAGLRAEMERLVDDWLAKTGDPCGSWDETIRQLGLQELWHRREHYMHPDAPRLLEGR